MPAPRLARRPSSGGFTLLEIMVVILIIGILAAALATNVPDFVDKARQTACERNMSTLYTYMVNYQSDHEGSWPRDQGQKFFLRLWKDQYLEHTESNAKRFFCPSEPPGEILLPDEDVIEYLDDWDGIGPGTTSYAGFYTGGDRELRRQLNKNPGRTTILSDAHMTHRTALIHMTGDGSVHKMLRADIENEYGMDLGEEDIVVGPGCEIEELQTVSNDE